MNPRQKAYDFIAEKVDAGLWKSREGIPSVRHLSRLIGVSYSPVFRAVRQLEAEGLLGRSSSAKRVGASVAGFDNLQVKSFERRLTTLDFNAAGFISRILGFIVRPPRRKAFHRHQDIEVESMTIERGTTGRPADSRAGTKR